MKTKYMNKIRYICEMWWMISQLYLKHKYIDCFIKLKDINTVPSLNVKRTKFFFLRKYTKTFSASLDGSGLRVTNISKM